MYGKLADRFSPFLDPPKGVAVTINGQLILLKLIEELDRVEGVRILSANTDGLLIHHPRKVLDQVDQAMKRVRAIYSLNKFDVVVCAEVFAVPRSMNTLSIVKMASSRSRVAVRRSTMAPKSRT